MTQRNGYQRVPILPERIRRIGRQSFAFIHHRFLRDGFVASLDREELTLYFFLTLAANRDGVSFYHYDRICDLLMLTIDDYLRARDGLIDKDLIAFDGTRFQVLELPAKPVLIPADTPPGDNEDNDPATVRALARRSLGLDYA